MPFSTASWQIKPIDSSLLLRPQVEDEEILAPLPDRSIAAERIAIPLEKRVTFADLKIQTKDQELVPFTPNNVQCEYLDEIWPEWRTEIGQKTTLPRGLREIILKARRFGFSTLIAALFFLDTVNTPNTTTVVVAHDGETTEELFSMIQVMYEHLPEEKRPHKKYDSKRQLTFDQIGSQYVVRTAGARAGAGRGMTIHNLHCSEAAYYSNRRLFRALLQAVAPRGNVFIESTANGESGDGEQYCQEYRKASGEIPPAPGRKRTPFTARFYPWWAFGEYHAKTDPGFVRDDEEVTIVNKYRLDDRYGPDLTNRKLQWRRNKMSEPDMGPSVFPQEYPGDDKEAFLVSGSRFFTDWDTAVHVINPLSVYIFDHWEAVGGYDWGYGAQACFLLGRIDPRGRVLITDEVYLHNATDPEQAQAVLTVLQARGLDPRKVPIYADPSMWAKKADNMGRTFQNVNEFASVGLCMVPASNDRIPGWQNVRSYLHARDFGDTTDKTGQGVPMLRVFDGRCPNLIRTMPLQIHKAGNVEDLDNKVESHPQDTLRYLLSSRPPATDIQPTPFGPEPARMLENRELPWQLQTEEEDDPRYAMRYE